ncbi:type VII secretion protein EccB [Streptomyces sp. NBC_00102]|uniref:type VII secretion protein EccB n=1 Tax=Streptomyces sp. NBC_00102 TaxID=2975652 RepID=UPI0022558C96|nr:type VII secretion protein EccB [Streptomyces sp. NBC_00102]MCX5400455.1 type VII secretion protein EccB [Streptomyces sp. NBC_00102]
MQTKRDQVQAHMFLMSRLTTSMLRSDPDAPESPQGRTNRGVAMGVLIAIMVSAGAFVFGLIKPGTTDSWRTSKALIVDEDTGTSYLYLDNRLRPVRNQTSARLLVGSELTTTTVHSSSLAGVDRGAPVGITGAPQTVPDGLDSGPWLVCSGTGLTSSGTSPGTAVAVGSAAGGTGLDANSALLARAPDKTLYLVWRGTRLRLDTKHGAVSALGYESATPFPVTEAFLDALPLGPDLTPVTVTGQGGTGPRLDGRQTRIGQVFQVSAPGSATRYYLLRTDGLTPLTATEAALTLGSSAGGGAHATDLGTDALSGRLAPVTGSQRNTASALPATPPHLVRATTDQSACVRISPGTEETRSSVSLLARSELGPAAQTPSEGMTPACVPADRITVPAGRGALVRALGAGGTAMGDTVYLVTDTGMKYRVPTSQALEALGFTTSDIRTMPSTLLSLLPTGPDLSPSAAAGGTSSATAPRCGPAGGAGSGRTGTAPAPGATSRE